MQLSTGFIGSVVRLGCYGSVHCFMLDSRHRMLTATRECATCTFQTVKGWDLMMYPPYFQVHLSYTTTIHCSDQIKSLIVLRVS